MIDRINSGDKQALKELLTRYTKPVYERALARLSNENDAREVTRAVLSDIMTAAAEGGCPENVSGWILSLVDRRMNERELDAILENALTDDPVGWNAPAGEWEPDGTVWNGDTAQTAQSEQPVQPVQPIEPVQPVQPVQPIEPAQPTRPVQPVQPVYTAQPEKTVHQTRYAPPDDRVFEEEDDDLPSRRKHGAGVGMVLLVLILLLLAGGLVWMLVVMLMTRGILPMADMGFAEWFNTNLFPLY